MGNGAEDKEGQALDFTAVKKKLTADAANYAGTVFAEEVRAILAKGASARKKETSAAAAVLQEEFEDAWKSQYQSTATDSLIGRAANRSRAKRSVRQKEFTDREKAQMLERLVGLSAKGLVEALHLIKQEQPDLDLGMHAEKIVIPFDEMSQDAFAALDPFLKKVAH